MDAQQFFLARQRMVRQQLQQSGIVDPQVLQAFDSIPRHQFVDSSQQDKSYQPTFLKIGHGQLMLSPLHAALAIQSMRLSKADRILEIGTGSGYLTAILATLGGYVYSLERIVPLAEIAAHHLHQIGISNVDLHIGDGSQGLPDMATFDAIIVTSYVPKVPKPLAKQLHPLRGRMVIPIGEQRQQRFRLVRREANQWHARTITRVRVLPLTGRYGAESGTVSV